MGELGGELRHRGGDGAGFLDDRVTNIVHGAAMLGLGVDTWQLYSRDDPYYEHWLMRLIDMVYRTYRDNKAKPNGR